MQVIRLHASLHCSQVLMLSSHQPPALRMRNLRAPTSHSPANAHPIAAWRNILERLGVGLRQIYDRRRHCDGSRARARQLMINPAAQHAIALRRVYTHGLLAIRNLGLALSPILVLLHRPIIPPIVT